MDNQELIAKMTKLIESDSYRVYRDQKAELIFDLCQAHCLKVAVEAVEKVMTKRHDFDTRIINAIEESLGGK